MSPNYYKRLKERRLQRSMAGVRARERKRMERNADCENWKRVRTLILVVHAAPDGRHIALQAHGRDTWHRCGSERSVRGALAKILWERS
jgi:hypothetical protein